jgi:hypothetical protein
VSIDLGECCRYRCFAWRRIENYGGIYREEIKGAGFLFDYGKLHG